jgi:hypothetical protein
MHTRSQKFQDIRGAIVQSVLTFKSFIQTESEQHNDNHLFHN